MEQIYLSLCFFFFFARVTEKTTKVEFLVVVYMNFQFGEDKEDMEQ